MSIQKINELWFPGEKITATRLNKITSATDAIIDAVNPMESQVINNTQAIQAIADTSTASIAADVEFADHEDAETKVSNLENESLGLSYAVECLVDDNAARDLRRIPMMGGQPAILFGAGAPVEAIVPDNWIQYDPVTDTGFNWVGLPIKIGQRYINTSATSGGCEYIAVPDNSSNRIKWLNV